MKDTQRNRKNITTNYQTYEGHEENSKAEIFENGENKQKKGKQRKIVPQT